MRIGERTKGEDQQEETGDGSVRCICACNMEKGEMGCCDMCEGWTHLRCLGMKEGVGGMVGKECVLFLCASVFASAEEGNRGVEKGSERREW